ncbi:MAG: PKD domain-containing protein, partial [Planctomycetota bacterium]
LTGGTEGANVLNTAEFTDDGLQYQANLQPQILTVGTPLVLNAGLALTGTQFKGITEATGGLSTMSATNYPVAFLRALDSERVIALLSDPAVPWSATTYKSAAIAAEFPRGYVMASVITNGISSPAVLVPSLLDTTTTAAAATVAYSPAAQNVTLNATVASSGGTVGEGNVTFHVKNGATLIGTAVQSTTVSNGVASVIYALPAGTTSGTYTIVATYGNAINFASSSDTTKALTISPYVTTTLSSNQTVPYSSAAQNVTLNALVTSSVAVNQGTVTFQLMNGATNVGVATVSTQVVEGAASVSYVLPAGTPVGTYTLIATYGNGTNFATSTDHVHLLTITPAATTTTASNQTCVYSSASQNVTLSATVNANGSTVNEGTVTFQLMNGATNVGVAVTSGTVSSGSASVSYALVAGTQVGAYTISAIYTPGSNFVGSSDNSKSLNVTYLSITIASNPTATPNPVLVNQSVSFSGAASGGTNALVYSWNFGDGTSASGASVSHVYSPAGTYSAVLSVTDGVTTEHSDISVLVNPLVSVIGSDVDSDGDGFSDSFENFVGTDPSNTASAPATGLIGALGLGKATIKLNFAKSVGDNIALNGTLNVPQGFNATGAVVYFDAGGIYKKLTLDRNGSAKSGNDSFKIALKSKNGIVQENPVAAFSATFMKGNFANALATVSQLNNANLTNVMRTVTFAVIFNNSALLKNQSMIYTAKQNKTGSAK